MSKFIPAPIGTVRGGYSCGWKGKAYGGIQYLVQGKNGWVPFIRACKDNGECREAAENYAKEILTK